MIGNRAPTAAPLRPRTGRPPESWRNHLHRVRRALDRLAARCGRFSVHRIEEVKSQPIEELRRRVRAVER